MDTVQIAVVHQNEYGQEINREEMNVSEQMSAADLGDAVAALVKKWGVGLGDVVRVVEV